MREASFKVEVKHNFTDWVNPKKIDATLESPENLMNYISDKIKEVLLKIFRKKIQQNLCENTRDEDFFQKNYRPGLDLELY